MYGIDGNYSFSITTKYWQFNLTHFLVVITQLLSWIIFINDYVCILTGSPGYNFFMILYVIQKPGAMVIIQLYQRNFKLSVITTKKWVRLNCQYLVVMENE